MTNNFYRNFHFTIPLLKLPLVCHVVLSFVFTNTKTLLYFNVFAICLGALQRILSFYFIQENILLNKFDLNVPLTFITFTMFCTFYLLHMRASQLLTVSDTFQKFNNFAEL